MARPWGQGSSRLGHGRRDKGSHNLYQRGHRRWVEAKDGESRRQERAWTWPTCWRKRRRGLKNASRVAPC
jgi:hypothetical protein